MAPLVVYLLSTRCASATPWNHRDHLRTRVAPAAAAYAARLEHPIVAVVDECSGEELPTCERCAPSPLAPLVSSECTNCDGVDVIVASCPGGKFGPCPGCKTDAAVALPLNLAVVDGPAAAALRRAAYLYRMPTNEHRIKLGTKWIQDGIDQVQRDPTAFFEDIRKAFSL